MCQEEKIVLLLDGNRGIYVPQGFAECFSREQWSYSKEDEEILMSGPDHICYWETWLDVVDMAEYTDDDGHKWHLWQDSDLWCIREDYDGEYPGF
jgi:hypothetical protein